MNTKSLYKMKKKIGNILGIVCVVAVIAACIVTDKEGNPCLWNYGLLALAGISGWASKKMEDAR